MSQSKGEQFCEHKGKITDQRVSGILEAGPKIEISISANGSLFREAVEVSETVTFWSTFRPGGSFYGEGQGVIMIKDGSGEIATITPQGIGWF